MTMTGHKKTEGYGLGGIIAALVVILALASWWSAPARATDGFVASSSGTIAPYFNYSTNVVRSWDYHVWIPSAGGGFYPDESTIYPIYGRNCTWDKAVHTKDATGNIYFAPTTSDSSCNPSIPYWDAYSGVWRKTQMYHGPKVIKLDNNGVKLWAKEILPGTLTDRGYVHGITADSDGDVYTYGMSYFKFDPHVDNGSGDMNPFIQKRRGSDGALLWTIWPMDLTPGRSPSNGVRWYYGGGIVATGSGSGKAIFATGTTSRVWDMSSSNNYATGTDSNGNLGIGGSGTGIPFVARLNPDTGAPVWSTFLASEFTAADIKLDSTGNPVVTGNAIFDASGPYPAPANWGSPPHPYVAGSNGSYVAKLDKNTGALLWNDFFGKNAYATKLAMDNNDTIYISGDTTSNWGAPLKNMYRGIGYCFGGTGVGGFDTFVVRMDKSGVGWNMAWNTFLGTFSPASSIALDEAAGYLYILSFAGMNNGCEYPGAFYSNGVNGSMIYQLATSGAATGRYAMLDTPTPTFYPYAYGALNLGWSILAEPAGTLLVAADNLNIARINFNTFITGVVKDGSGTAVAGAVVSTNLGTSVVTGADGSYRLHVNYGSSLTLTVSYPGATSPASVPLSNVTTSITQDFTFSGIVTGWGGIVIDGFSSPQRLYTALDGKGVYWRLKDGGSWSAATTQPTNKAFRGLLVSPASPSTLFAATYGGGVYKSTNSGVDWAACTNSGLSNLNLLTLVADSAGKLYAGTEAGVYSSSDCATWTAVNSGLP